MISKVQTYSFVNTLMYKIIGPLLVDCLVLVILNVASLCFQFFFFFFITRTTKFAQSEQKFCPFKYMDESDGNEKVKSPGVRINL